MDKLTKFYNRITCVTAINITLYGLNINETNNYIQTFNEDRLWKDMRYFFEFWLLIDKEYLKYENITKGFNDKNVSVQCEK